MVEKARSLGFDTLSFSIHAFMWYSESMSKFGDKTSQYVEEIKRLKEVYKDKINNVGILPLIMALFSVCLQL